MPTKRKVGVPPAGANVVPPQEQQPAPAAHPLPAEFYGPQAEQLHTAYFCLERVPNAGATQCYDELMRCAEGREIFGLHTLCEARPVVHCFFAIGDMWVVPFCYRTDAVCQRLRKGLNGPFEKTPCAHTVRSALSVQESGASP